MIDPIVLGNAFLMRARLLFIRILGLIILGKALLFFGRIFWYLWMIDKGIYEKIKSFFLSRT